MRSILQGMQSGWTVISQLWAHTVDQAAVDPAVRQDRPARARTASSASLASPASPAPAPRPWSKVIVVFGDTLGDPVARALSDAGYSVSLVASLPLAQASLDSGQVALIVLHGAEVTGKCRALRQATSVPILALLPELSEAAVLDAFSAGADDCQAVSISPSEIVLRVRAILRRGKARAAAPGDMPGESDAQMRKAA